MAYERFAAPPNERLRYGCAIADVNLHVFQGCSSIMNKNEIGRVENTRSTRVHAISNGWSQNGMFNRKRLKRDAANLRRRTLIN
jgi:hypothetical protein